MTNDKVNWLIIVLFNLNKEQLENRAREQEVPL